MGLLLSTMLTSLRLLPTRRFNPILSPIPRSVSPPYTRTLSTTSQLLHTPMEKGLLQMALSFGRTRMVSLWVHFRSICLIYELKVAPCALIVVQMGV